MRKRTETEIEAYVDGYNDCFKMVCECLKGRKSSRDAFYKMQTFLDAVNACVEIKERNTNE